MSLNSMLIAELKKESASTRKILEKVPMDKVSWKPHERSMNLGDLATHVADITKWVEKILTTDEIDAAVTNLKPDMPHSNEDLLAMHDSRIAKAIAVLEAATEEDMNKVWRFRRGDVINFELPKKIALRNIAMNHLYHHRGQLSVYLRLNDVAIPGMYGPSADDKLSS